MSTQGRTEVRENLLSAIADAVGRLDRTGIRRIGVDGVDGAGKTFFADELAGVLEARAENVVRASIDNFHAPRSVRHRRGRTSPEGFFRDSYDYELVRTLLLDPTSIENRRYVEGQRLYFAECRPHSSATIVIDNNDLENPYVRSGAL
jgi:hypothetical protein